MSTISAKRLRLPINVASFDEPRDQMTGRDVIIVRGADYSFEIAAFFGPAGQSNLVSSLSNWTILKVQILPLAPATKQPDLEADPLVSVLTDEFNSSLTWTQWNDLKTHAHATVTATKGQMAVPQAGGAWLVVSVTTDNSPSHWIPLLSGPITIQESGYSDGTPPGPVESYYTSDEIDALLADELDLNYIGPWDASGGTLPDTAGRTAKDFYVITVGGEVDEVTYLISDRIVFNGVDWDRLPAIGSYAAAAATSAAAAEAAKVAALAAQAAAETAQSETENLRDETQTLKDQAATSETNAAASAVTALNAIAGLFISGIAGDSVPAVPIPASGPAVAGHHYRITAAGTAQSYTWAIGDAAIYNGTSGSWTRLPGYYAGHVAITRDGDAFRVPAPRIISDGGGTNRRAEALLGTRGNVQSSTRPLSWHGRIFVPTANLAAEVALSSIGASNTSATGPNTLYIGLGTGRDLRIHQRGNSAGDFGRYIYGLSSYAGQWIAVDVTVYPGVWTTAPALSINDVSIDLSAAGGSSGTAPDWLGALLTPTYLVSGLNAAAGEVTVDGVWFLGSLTAAERTAWFVTGQPPFWVAQGGYGPTRITNGSFTTDTSGWITGGTAPTVASVAGELEFTPAALVSASFLYQSFTARAGAQVTVRATGRLGTAAGSVVVKISQTPTGNGAPVTLTFSSTSPVTLEGTGVLGLIGSIGENDTYNVVVRQETGTLGTSYIDNIAVYVDGALAMPVIGPDRVLLDRSKSTPPIDSYLLGMVADTPQADGWIRATRVGAGYFTVDAQLVGDGREIVQAFLRASADTTISLGDSAGAPATIVASVALTAGQKTPLTLLPKSTATTKIYGASSASTALELWVRTGPITSLV